MTQEAAETEIFYVADPMCSWCWGFAPAAQAIVERFPDTAFTLVLGGLRPGDNAEPLDERLRTTIEPHWRRVQETTGQPFDFAFFDRQDFIFDTEPACRAVVAVRRIAPDRAFPFFVSIQRAFYADNVDITDAGNYRPMLDEHDIREERFMTLFDDEQLRRETYGDFMLARRLGARGFPTIVMRKDEQLALLTVGYQPFETLEPEIARYFDS